MTEKAHRHQIVLGIDASRNRSGGAKTHLLGILRGCPPQRYGIARIHIWSYKSLLDALPDEDWIVKHTVPELERTLLHQVWWQFSKLHHEVARAGCDILLTTDAGSVGRFTPSIVMSRDMLSFEPGEMERYPIYSSQRLRLQLLKGIQVRALRRASGALFLTQYAASVIGRFTGHLKTMRVIPHGIGDEFRVAGGVASFPKNGEKIRCLYVSNVDRYKHQWNVVRAIAALRRAGVPVELHLVGGGAGEPRERLERVLAEEDPSRAFVSFQEAVPHRDVPRHLSCADIFVFASSCENMPNTLIEAMAAGLPIACSNRGPMPEVLGEAGVYFDPEDSRSIEDAVGKIATDAALRVRIAEQARNLASHYSWERCARETWAYIADVSAEQEPIEGMAS